MEPQQKKQKHGHVQSSSFTLKDDNKDHVEPLKDPANKKSAISTLASTVIINTGNLIISFLDDQLSLFVQTQKEIWPMSPKINLFICCENFGKEHTITGYVTIQNSLSVEITYRDGSKEEKTLHELERILFHPELHVSMKLPSFQAINEMTSLLHSIIQQRVMYKTSHVVCARLVPMYHLINRRNQTSNYIGVFGVGSHFVSFSNNVICMVQYEVRSAAIDEFITQLATLLVMNHQQVLQLRKNRLDSF